MHELAIGELEISVEDFRKAVKNLKGGKLPGVDGTTSEMLKCGGECLLEWLRRVYNVCILEEKVPNDWMGAYSTNIYKGFFVCLFVSITLCKNLSTDFDEIFWKCQGWHKEESVKPCPH